MDRKIYETKKPFEFIEGFFVSLSTCVLGFLPLKYELSVLIEQLAIHEDL